MDGTFVQAIVDNSKPAVDTRIINGRTYASSTNNPMQPVMDPTIDALEVHTLQALIDYIASGDAALTVTPKLLLLIKHPGRVELLSEVFGAWQQRHTLTIATLTRDAFPYVQYMDQETFKIRLAAGFAETPDRETLINFAGNLQDKQIVTSTDDGISQNVTVSTGIGQAEKVEVRPYFDLAPYRTFPEVTQPTSRFVFRMAPGAKCALFEADGGAWKLDAIEAIAQWLAAALPEGTPATILG
jgi:hypothetical protein